VTAIDTTTLYTDLKKFIDYKTKTLHSKQRLRLTIQGTNQEVTYIGFSGESYLVISIFDPEKKTEATRLLPPAPIPLQIEIVLKSDAFGISKQQIGFCGDIQATG